MVWSKQKRMKDVVVGVGVVGVSVVVGCLLELFWGRNGNWWEEEQSANGDWISLQNGTPKTLHPIFPILWAWLLFFYVCCCCLLLVCLSVYLFDCLSVFMSGWLVGWLVGLFVKIVYFFVCLFDWLFCMFVWMFDCLFALQWGRFHHPFCNFCKSQITVQNLDFVGGLLDGGIGVWIELSVCRNLLFCSILVHIFSPSILWALGMLIAVPER